MCGGKPCEALGWKPAPWHGQVKQPTLSLVVKALVRKRWVTKRRSITDTRAVCLSLSRRGAALALQSEHRVRHVRPR
jgi:DNA-binding MarR family transcriptional regulator